VTDTIDRLKAALADRYRIERELGAGGMATVYLAADLKHDRQVAIKVLKPELAAVLGAERFVQEIKTTAALSHPHILPLFDSGEADGFLYYVMPYLQGETIRDKLNRETQLGIEEAVRLAAEVADALDYAHRHGVIHRDIKPENILLHDGRAMVMDFGIALAVSAAAGGRMTETGLSLGTPHYMSPEQATAEKDLTARSDVYSLGSVLYEMLTGNPPHVGASAQQIIMKIVTEEAAPVTKARKSVPPNVAAAVAMALEKLPADRFESAKAFADALANAGFTATGAAAALSPAALGWRRHAGAVVTALAAVAVTASALAIAGRRGPRDTPVNWLSLAIPEAQHMTAPGGTRVAWAPDGRAFVYVGVGAEGSQLWLRSLDALEATPIAGSERATSPFFSPDGTQIGFVTINPFAVWIVPRVGGTAQLVVRDSVSGGGGWWDEDGFIYYDGISSLARIRPDGSGHEVLYRLDTLRSEVGLAWPQTLPGGSTLFRVRRTGEQVGDYRILVADGQTGGGKFLVQATLARYLPTGHLVYVTADGTVMASRFDLDRLELTGAPIVLFRGIGVGGFGAADLAVSAGGDLLYTTGASASIAQPTWVTRSGSSTPVDTAWPTGLLLSIALSPDGSQMATEFISGASGTGDIWIKRLDTGPLSRLTFEGANRSPTWSHDGRDVYFVADHGAGFSLYRQRADGSAPPRQVASPAGGLSVGLESPDGRWLVLESAKDPCCDILGFRVGVDSVPTPLVTGPFRERSATLSQDGRWLAYTSDETGQFEVYVRPFPDVQSGKWQISNAGGFSPHWSHRGDELFYLDLVNDMIAARVSVRPGFAVLGRERLFSAADYILPLARRAAYEVSPDDQRFLMLRLGAGDGAASLVLVQNFLTEVRRAAPR